MNKLIATVLLGFATATAAQSPILVDPTNGKYLGNLNNNTLDPNSVSNPLGRYGNPLSPDSINNPLGKYGNPLSPHSVNNPLSTSSPRIVSPPTFGPPPTRGYGW